MFRQVVQFSLACAMFIAVTCGAFAQYQINGDASQISCNCFQLTPDVQTMSGSVWNTNQIDLNNSFDLNFEVWLGCNNGGADGIGFVLQPLGVNQGGGSNALGYGGISPSLAVEIDIFSNGAATNDPPEDHIAIMQNGVSDHGTGNNLAGPVTASSSQNNIEDCQWHDIQITWDPAINSIAVYFDGVFRTSYTGNIINNIFGGNSNVYWGWTGGTGGISADQRFCNALNPDFNIISTTACVGDVIQFEDASVTSTGNISNYSWDFGDGNTGSGNPVTHSFNTSGTFDVELTITSEGCTETTVIPVDIDPSAVVDLGPDLNICTGETAQLNNPNTLGSGDYQWTPATDLSSTVAPSPTTSTTSTITYSLTYTSNNGCSDSDDITVNVSNGPTANAGQDVTICENDQTTLQASGGTNYSWSPTTGLDDPNIANPVASPLTTTTYTVTVSDATNCSATDDVTITVAPAPVIDAGLDEVICEGDNVQLNAVGIGTYSWTPTVGLSSTTVNDPIATPTVSTMYYATITDGNNCSATDSVFVEVEEIPTADFPDPVPTCDGSPVQFNDNSSGPILTYSWDFGDGQFGSGTNPTHTYAAIGSYTVQLTVVSNNGCTSSATGTAQVVDGPLPYFTVTNGLEVCVNEVIQINDNSSGQIVGYNWDFGDGFTTTDLLPTHSYSTSGPFTITLQLTAPDNCASTESVDILVNPNPEAAFNANQGCENQSTTFSDQSTVTTGFFNRWEWDFGDGVGSSTAEDPTYAYVGVGDFDVTLVVETAAGCTDTIIQQVSVNPTPDVQFTASNSCIGDDVIITNNTTPNDNTIAQWDWTFGDGNTSPDIQPSHQYNGLGTFTIQLTATSDSGCVASATQDVEVYPYPNTDFSFSSFEGCAPFDVVFENESTINPNYAIGSYEWSFGDGNTSSSESPSNTYTTSGTFDVSLITTTQDGGCSDTLAYSDLVTVFLTPEASFYFDPENPTTLNPTIQFFNTTTDGANYIWNFGDGNTSTAVNPENEYLEEGSYFITLIATNGICTSSASDSITIDPETFIYIPNAFTPNGNELNDGFIPKGIGIIDFNMTIYDRWGNQLYYTATMDEPWNGLLDGREMPADVYVYRIDIVDILGEERCYRGNVTIVR